MSKSISPWQSSQWQLLWQAYRQQRLPHALLLSGIAGIGKKQFALSFAHAVFCEKLSETGDVCGECRHCHLINAKFHPDLLMVEPEESGQMIKIDQIRALVEFVNESAQQGSYRIIILDPANAMNVNSANALLKSLEEPSSKCLFMLVSNQSLRLLPTIKSRCQEVKFSKPDKLTAMKWLSEQQSGLADNAELLLSLTNGAPQKALELLNGDFLKNRQDFYQSLYALSQRKEEPLQVATRWLEVDVLTLISLMQSWLRDLIVIKLTNKETRLVNIDFSNSYSQLTQNISLRSLLSYSDYIQNLNTKMTGSLNLNRQLVLEELFIKWARVH